MQNIAHGAYILTLFCLSAVCPNITEFVARHERLISLRFCQFDFCATWLPRCASVCLCSSVPPSLSPLLRSASPVFLSLASLAPYFTGLIDPLILRSIGQSVRLSIHLHTSTNTLYRQGFSFNTHAHTHRHTHTHTHTHTQHVGRSDPVLRPNPVLRPEPVLRPNPVLRPEPVLRAVIVGPINPFVFIYRSFRAYVTLIPQLR